MEEGRYPIASPQLFEGQSYQCREDTFSKHIQKLRDQIKALKFGLSILVNPDCDPCAPFILEGSIFNDSQPISLVSWSIRENEYGEYVSPLIKNNYIVVEIDVSRKKKEINDYLNVLLDESKEEHAKIMARQGKPLGGVASRNHYQKRLEYYEVWDLKQEGKTYKEIAFKVKRKDEDLDTVIERTKKRYLVAFDLIQGAPSKEERKTWANNIKGFCKDCRDTKCLDDYKRGKQWRPCPRLVAAGGDAFLNQDEKKSTGALLSPNTEHFGR